MVKFELYTGDPGQEKLLEALPTIEWGAGKFLYKEITGGMFHQQHGKSARLYFVRDTNSEGADRKGADCERINRGGADHRNADGDDADREDGPLAGFGAIVEQDYHPVPEWQRWIAFVYVWPEYRGRQLSREIVQFLEGEIAAAGEREVHILTQHRGLYEKYGYELVREEDDGRHAHAYIYHKELTESPTK
ncbi:MAG: GNAT family N-acetyltransferase [Arcanobacterium sp.]|nr:GNAT family N-acetyltransferase [Arcanobacterium sp.]MDY5588346.1 GNAT family N-acetyltransferase [Arcanobacterium sp.]